MDGLVKSAGKSCEDHDLVLYLIWNSVGPSSGRIENAYPTHLSLQLREAGDTLHEIGRVQVPILD